jgi:predicted SAM-dependent methyltransferase
MLKQLSLSYIKGRGIEIGAYTNPQKVNAIVTYVDRCTGEERYKAAPHLVDGTNFVPVDIIDDGETLSKIPDNSQDFVITSHVIEHFGSPLTALRTWDRVLVPGGVMWITIPDKRYTFDKDREITGYRHLIADWYNPPIKEEFEAHEHVWDQAKMLEMLTITLPDYDIEMMFKGKIDSTFVLRKPGGE